MTKRQHFERWIKQVKPNMPLDYNESEGYYYHDIVSLMWQAWQASPKTRPTEPGKITKEQLAELRKPNPETIVDRLRGIYPGIASAYPVTPLQREAADTIEGLRSDAVRYRWLRSDKEGKTPLIIHNLWPYGKTFGSPEDFDAAIDAALKGKP